MKKKRLIITAGAKGGTGKTLTTTLLHAWLVDQKIRVALFDGDAENSTLSRFVSESIFIDMRDPSALDQILVPLQFDEADVVLLDSRAATSDELISWLQQLGVQALHEELFTRITIVAMVTHSRDTLEQLKRWTENLGTDVDWLIARNLVGGQVDEYDGSQLRASVLKKLRAGEISIPLLPAYVVRELEKHGLTISQARLCQGISWANRRRCQCLHDQLSAQCAATQKQLLP